MTPTAALFILLGALWTTQGVEGFLPEEPEFSNVTIDPEGNVSLAPPLAERVALDEASVWSLVETGNGRVVAATGNHGRVYSVPPVGAPSVVFEMPEGEVLALCRDASGDVLFGTTPGGRVYRLGPDGEPQLLDETGEEYIFALLPGRDGAVYCATGTGGRLLRIDRRGDSRVLFAAPQTHLTALAWLVPDRELLVGTAPDGLVYRLVLDPGASPAVSVLYDTPLAEVRALAVSGDTVYVGANPDEDSENGSSPWVGCVTLDGILRWEWTPPESTVFSLAAEDRGLLVATGVRGFIYRLEGRGRAAVLQQADHRNVIALVPGPSGIWVGTSQPAALLRLDDGLAEAGELLSAPHDCEGPAAFGRIDVRADVPSGSGLVIETRSGNSETPDSTWNGWQPAGTTVASPAARFVQWRALLRSEFPGRTPVLHRVDLYYAIPNRAPSVDVLTVAEPDRALAARGEVKPVREITWEASDPDDDSLVFELQYRTRDARRWVTARRDIETTTHNLDMRTLPDGWYRFRLLASDRGSQPADVALEGERVSLPLLVDNSPPVVEGLAVKDGRVGFVVRDALSAIAGCRVSVNAGEWRLAAPADGLFDSPAERFSVPLELEPGENTVAVWAADAQGNTAAARRSVR